MKQIIVKNPNNLPCIEHNKLTVLQGDLKTLSEEDMGKLCHSIQKYGFFVPAFIWKSERKHYILDATQRYHALKRMKEEGYDIPPIPYVEIEAEDKKDAAEKLLQITSRYGKINPDTSFLTDFDLKIDDIEIDIPELELELVEEKAEIEEDEVPEIPSEPLTKSGELWLCGKHKVLCGDCTKVEDVERVMDGKKADMMFTDPPYGVSYADKNTFLNAIDEGNRIQDKIEGDAYQEDNTEELWLSSFQNIKTTLADDASFYICSASSRELLMTMFSTIKKAGLDVYHILIWIKNNHVLGRSDYNYKHEPILYGWNKKHVFYGKGAQKTTVWQYDKPHKSDLHPVMKPIDLVANALLNSSKKGDICIDFFLGSGTSLIAAEQTNRICYGMEIEPRYIDVILDRYTALTGEDPVREDGIKWSELKTQNDTK